MEPIQFEAWQKIGRYRRNSVVSEKIDGMNAAVGVVEIERSPNGALPFGWDRQPATLIVTGNGAETRTFLVYAQSRTRIITPEADNFGFARWAYENAETLAADLGPGLHFGEWWGHGIQRGYGQTAKRLSLFNTSRWAGNEFVTPNLGVVPVIGHGALCDELVEGSIGLLRKHGSVAAPGFMNPEGIVIFHLATHHCYKVTIAGDDSPKSLGQHADKPKFRLVDSA
jgi:hypothetical protein